jgi:hypothetical protein
MKYFLILTIILFYSCGKEDEQLLTHVQMIKTQTSENLKLVLENLKELEVEVMFEAGAEPYTDNSFRQQPYWNFFESNIEGIYKARSMNPTIIVPKSLDKMRMLEIQDKDSWTVSEIRTAINKHSQVKATIDKAVVKVIFVRGYFKGDDGVVNQNVIGINVTGTFDVAIFKDVVERMGTTVDDKFAKFAEQSTLIHEFGHAIGLVNNGVAQIEDHHDHEHGAHCKNPDCVMYWKNEGATDTLEFIQNYFNSGSEMMIKEQCLEDLSKYKSS